ncbi:unnamed protein product, partial [Iphiclides podalirius]
MWQPCSQHVLKPDTARGIKGLRIGAFYVAPLMWRLFVLGALANVRGGVCLRQRQRSALRELKRDAVRNLKAFTKRPAVEEIIERDVERNARDDLGTTSEELRMTHFHWKFIFCARIMSWSEQTSDKGKEVTWITQDDRAMISPRVEMGEL